MFLGPSHHRKLTTLHGPGHCWVRNSTRVSSWGLELIGSHPWGQHLTVHVQKVQHWHLLCVSESPLWTSLGCSPGSLCGYPTRNPRSWSLSLSLRLEYCYEKAQNVTELAKGEEMGIKYTIFSLSGEKISIIKLQIIWNFSRALREVSLPKIFMGKHAVSTNEK